MVGLRKGGILIIKTKGDNVTTSRLLLSGGVRAILCSKGGSLSMRGLCRGTPGLGKVPILLKRLVSRRLHTFSMTILDPNIPASLPIMRQVHTRGIYV